MKASKSRRAAANALLDAAKRGETVTTAQITEALRVTGDLEDIEPTQIIVPAGQWERKHARLLGRASWLDPIH